MKIYIAQMEYLSDEEGWDMKDALNSALSVGPAFRTPERAMAVVQEHYDLDRAYEHELNSIDEEPNPEVNFPEHTWEFERIQGTKYWASKPGPKTDYGYFYARVHEVEVNDQ